MDVTESDSMDGELGVALLAFGVLGPEGRCISPDVVCRFLREH